MYIDLHSSTWPMAISQVYIYVCSCVLCVCVHTMPAFVRGCLSALVRIVMHAWMDRITLMSLATSLT